jgi:protein gp37
MKAPFPWFGGKSRVGRQVWARFGDVRNYVEPFAGSLAVLLARESEPKIETVNDLDCWIANFWRALQSDPEGVAYWADWPVNEADLHARHMWLVQRSEFRERMKTDPGHFDVKIAGWWVWGISQWIGSGWCSKRPYLTNHGGGMGVHSQASTVVKRPRLARGGRGVVRQIPDLSGDSGAAGRGIHASGKSGLGEWLYDLSSRLRRVRVCCGDWARIVGPAPTTCIATTGVFLDPPYAVQERGDVYGEDSREVAHHVRDWAVLNGDNPLLRIALCGYDGEHQMPASWDVLAWKANGGYGNQKSVTQGKSNAHRERMVQSALPTTPAGPIRRTAGGIVYAPNYMNQTSIEWTDVTWNPTRGCSRVSEGCRNCYAERIAGRFCTDPADSAIAGGQFGGFAIRTSAGPRWTGKVELIESKLHEPLHWRKPRKVFVNSMSDLFHENLSFADILQVMITILGAPQHDFQVLTKRPERAKQFFLWWDRTYPGHAYPPNLWLGTSIEDQPTANKRILSLLQTPAAVRFVSYEPALGPVDFTRIGGNDECWLNSLDGKWRAIFKTETQAATVRIDLDHCPALDWIIVGGESGPDARPFDVQWARDVVAQCQDAVTAVFVKQLGSNPRDGFELGTARPPSIEDRPRLISLRDRKGGDWNEWEPGLRVREFPQPRP